ncbi:zf-HC2 domain-containing protein [Krasilnikovia sp. MM14-A1259]|uniref:zf-HC2 domain-containing protein n=1 Tax=Krasilnikovia sp. MM14-A1259 TaxID=3373539 RepID=UPI0037FC2F2A
MTPDVSHEHDELRMLLGGYLLGGLDEGDTERLDAHLLGCDQCRDELERLAPIPELLQRLPDAARDAERGGTLISLSARPSAERVEELLSRMRAERTRDRRMARVRWLAAAAVVLIAALIGFGVVTADRRTTPPEALPSPQLVTARFEPATGSGLTGQAIVSPKAWGVAISLDVSRLEGKGPFVCQVRDASGQLEQAAAWGATVTGEAKVTGASSIQLRDVRAISIADRDGHVLGTARLS